MEIKAKNHYLNLQKLAVILAISGIFGGVGAYRRILSDKENSMQKPDTTIVIPTVKNPIKSVAYHNDTIDTQQSILLLYCNKQITRFYMEGNQSFRMRMPYFVHEWWHEHNDELKYRTDYNLSPEEYFKLCIHDEISANLAAILTARYEYLSTPDKKSVIKKYGKTYMRFYFEAIEKGKIHPERFDAENREKEWRFLANGVRDMWMRLYYNTYASRTIRMLERFLSRKGLVQDSGHNYEHLMHKMFTIGGIDFARYMDHDIITANNKVELAENLRKVDDLRIGGREVVDQIYHMYPIMKNVGFEDRIDVLQHILIAARMRYLLKNIDAQELTANGALLNTYFQQVSEAFRRDRFYKDLLNNLLQTFPITPMAKTDPSEMKKFLQQIYTINTVNILQFVEGFNSHDVPISKSDFLGRMRGDTKQLPFLFSYTPESMALESLRNKSALLHNKTVKSAAAATTKTTDHRRVSEDFYINIPNFREPILSNPTPKQTLEIYNAIQNFEAIPSVLKGCDTKAKRKYANEHPDTITKLQLGREYLAQ